MNYIAGGNPIADAVTAIGLYIAFYYGLTGFACVWYYRDADQQRPQPVDARHPARAGRGLMYAAGIYALQSDWASTSGYTYWTVPGLHWKIGGTSSSPSVPGWPGCPVRVHAVHRTRVLQGGNADPGHADPRARPGRGAARGSPVLRTERRQARVRRD